MPETVAYVLERVKINQEDLLKLAALSHLVVLHFFKRLDTMLRLFCSFREVRGIDDFSPANIKKGTLHVFAVEERVHDDAVSLHAKCVSQVKDSVVYEITVRLDSVSRTLSEARCTCKAGIQGKCKHAAAVCIHINSAQDNFKTPQAWGKPNQKPQRDQEKTIPTLFPAGTLKCGAHVTAAHREIVGSFAIIECSFAEVLELMKKSETERECETLLREIITKVSEEIEQDILAAYLEPMQHRARTWHFMAWKTDECQRHVLAPKGFLRLLDDKERQFYRDSLVLKCDIASLAVSTSGQSHNSRFITICVICSVLTAIPFKVHYCDNRVQHIILVPLPVNTRCAYLVPLLLVVQGAE
ncbi:uncharacterized protein LOC135392914 [Ornithodoros turicata]|uniref:uncharacterized protein LOC135392914 n=1 Tax=Ornithodoros turicata TaxID=34597 RepID=UPI00313A236F